MKEYLNNNDDIQFSLNELMSIVHNSKRPLRKKIKFYKEIKQTFKLNDEEKENIERLISTYEKTFKYINKSHEKIVYILKQNEEYQGVFDNYKYVKKYHNTNYKEENEEYSNVYLDDYIKEITYYTLEEVNTITNDILAIYNFDSELNWISYEFYNYRIHKSIPDVKYSFNGTEFVYNKNYNKYPENLYVYIKSPFKIGDIVEDIQNKCKYIVINPELPTGSVVEISDNFDMCITVVPIKYKNLVIEKYFNKRKLKNENLINKNNLINIIENLDELSLYHEHLNILNLELIEDIKKIK